MLVMMGNSGKARFDESKGEIVYCGFRILQDEVIALEYEGERILEITKEKRIFYKPTPSLGLKKELDYIKLDDRVTITFSNCDIRIEIYNIFIIEFQGFLEDGWEIELP